ncbi:hypothetical protein OAF34_03100, partial [Pirellulaceae bacterium]|nr:hypothetical protein [Pirellulaceae bacterium]
MKNAHAASGNQPDNEVIYRSDLPTHFLSSPRTGEGERYPPGNGRAGFRSRHHDPRLCGCAEHQIQSD